MNRRKRNHRTKKLSREEWDNDDYYRRKRICARKRRKERWRRTVWRIKRSDHLHGRSSSNRISNSVRNGDNKKKVYDDDVT